MAITINDIAKAANVSKATVSYVINNKPGVSEDTRQKILKIIEEMNYHPNAVARGLAGQKTEMIGMVIPDLTDMFFADIIRGVENCANQYNYTLNLCTTHADPERENAMADMFTSGRVDGVILMTYHLKEDYLHQLKNRQIPFVIINNPISDPSLYTINVNNQDGAYKGTEYLIQSGHQRIAFIHGSLDSFDNEFRFLGYQKAMADYQLNISEEYIRVGHFNHSGGYTAAQEFMKLDQPPTAIFAANDHMALGVIKALKDLGYTVPGDVSVIGFDDIQAASFVEPGLTTIKQPTFEMGARAVEILMKLIQGEALQERKILLETSFITRGTVTHRIK